MVIKKLSLKDTIEKDFIVFNILNDGLGYFVSESLKDKILNEKCTGIILT